jgi:hypothetical protein
MRLANLTPAAITSAPPAAAYTVTVPPTGLGGAGGTARRQAPAAPSPRAAGGADADSPDAARFRGAAGVVLAAVHSAPADQPLAAALDIPALVTTVLTRLDPATTVPARLSSIVTMRDGVPWAHRRRRVRAPGVAPEALVPELLEFFTA